MNAAPGTASGPLAALGPEARARLHEQVLQVRTDPAAIRTRFPAAARDIGRSHEPATDPGAARVEDAVRSRLLDALAVALHGDPVALSSEVHDLYRYGDADERRAVLRSLHRLGLGDQAEDLVHDGLRTNDPRLVAAAMGPYGETVLDADAWRQGVLKCLFIGVPLDLVSGFGVRADDALTRMVAAYADERTAAGRSVPEDARRILTTTRET